MDPNEKMSGDQMERRQYETYRGLGFSKGEAMKAVNKLGQIHDKSRETFVRKHHEQFGEDLSDSREVL